MAVLDRIKFDGLTNREWLLYHYPGESFVLGSSLIVGEGQVAVFVNGGRICDVFYPGTYILSTNNLPVLHSLINLPYGGKTPFPAEIYFVNTTTKLDMHWGTTDAIQLIDPKYFVRLHIRAFGQFGLKITDYETFLREIIGALGNAAVNYSKVRDYYKGVLVTKIKTIIADVIINKKISAMEITPKLEEISALALESIQSEFNKYGFNITNFYIQSINFPDEDFQQINKILEDKASFEIMGDGRYAAKRSFDVYEGAATNANGVAGAVVAGGVGLGAGLGMVQNIPAPIVPPQNNTMCSKCGAANTSGSKFCNSCGANLLPEKKKCQNCGCLIADGAKFCPECGMSTAPKKCQCGAELDGNVKFCPECGAKTEE